MGRKGYVLVGVCVPSGELDSVLASSGLVREKDFWLRREFDLPGTERYSICYNLQLEGKDKGNLFHLIGKKFSCYRSSEDSQIVEASEVKLETLLEAVQEVRKDFENPSVFYNVGLIE